MGDGMKFAAKTAFEKRLLEKLSTSKLQSAHLREQRRWRRFSMLLSSVFFASFFLHTENPIVIGGTLIVALACAYGAGMSNFGRTTRAASPKEPEESP